MSKLDQVKWQPVCCAEHGQYAEAPTVDGGVTRLERMADGIRVTRFDAHNQRVDEVPVLMTADEVEALLA